MRMRRMTARVFPLCMDRGEGGQGVDPHGRFVASWAPAAPPQPVDGLLAEAIAPPGARPWCAALAAALI